MYERRSRGIKKTTITVGTNRKQIRVADLNPITSIINIKCKWTKYSNLKAKIVRLGKKTQRYAAFKYKYG